VGDFSGRAWRKNSPRSFKPQSIDRDNFDELLEEMQVALKVHGVNFSFRELEDFHADRIYQSAAPLFQDLERKIQNLEPPKAAPASAPGHSRGGSEGGNSGKHSASSGSLLDEIVSGQSEEPSAPVSVSEANDLAAFIDRITKGYTVPRQTTAEQQRAARRDALASEALRAILHHPRIQALEAAWRALYMLVRGLNTDEDLKISILNITLPELISEMDTVHKELKRKGPWAVIAANYSFGQSELDTQALHRMGRLAKALGAPFLAEAHLQEDEHSEDWHDLRHSAEATWIGLALPRFLLRLPYGKDTSAIDSFPFEEMPKSEHKAYLWGNPAFFCAYLLGQSFLAHGWSLNPIERRIDNLPMHVYHEDGESVAKPCAEVLLTEREALKILDAGFMPLASLKYEPAAMVVRFQSIAEPPTPLSGLP
jgi:type VI secretion system protein ImpC